MMRNVAIGAVLGFGLVVALLTVFNNEPPPPAPAPAPAVAAAPRQEADAAVAVPVLQPVGAAPIVTPELKVNRNRGDVLREIMMQRRQMMVQPAPAADAGP